MNQLPSIDFNTKKRNPTLDSNVIAYELPYYKDAEYLADLENYTQFINSVKAMIRSSKQYKRYIKHLTTEVGLTYCQVLSDIDGESADIHMHHGPILTIEDYISVILTHLLEDNNTKITTFLAINLVLQEHFENNVQVVMLSETVHEQVHEQNIFLNYKHAFGNLNRFLKRYNKGVYMVKDKIERYIMRSSKFDSYDSNVLELKDAVHKWSK